MTKPLYLSGASRDEIVGEPFMGFMRTPNIGNRAKPGRWAADTGLFSQKGERAWKPEKYLKWLAKQDATTCLFANAPDVYAQARPTLERSAPFYAQIRALGLPVGLVAQDGMEDMIADIPWDGIDCLFIGGTTEWKLGPGAAKLAHEAKAHGKWLHMGRVSSLKRYRIAAELGCDSVDGTYIGYGPSINFPKVKSWIASVPAPEKVAA